MRVLIVGGGGREHALAWKVSESARVTQVYVAPGNAGTALEPRVRNVAIPADDLPGLLRFAREERIDLTIVGPEGPLVAGIVDAFAGAGLRCFGPVAAAARLEGSKAYSKAFLERHAIPTAAYATFTRASFDADWIRAQRAPLVVKADGLAAGKGVVICESPDEAIAIAEAMFAGRFGPAGDVSWWRSSSRARKRALSPWSTDATCCRLRHLRITSGCATAISDRTPAAWARIRPRRS
jgi:phosphoribosylamine--glycine ligase